jgi:hypothetical protein
MLNVPRFITSHANVWDTFKKLLPTEAANVVKYKNGAPNTIILSMSDGNTAEFRLAHNSYTYYRKFK